MVPRPAESKAQFIARLRAASGDRPVGFGGAHHTHAVVVEDGAWRVRRLVLPQEKADAYLQQHGHFMPENAEALSEPTGAIVLEAATKAALIELLERAGWPL